jgi:heptosyltransferase I
LKGASIERITRLCSSSLLHIFHRKTIAILPRGPAVLSIPSGYSRSLFSVRRFSIAPDKLHTPGWARRAVHAEPIPSLCENCVLQTQSSFRLLVVRLGAMGDILHGLPAVTALRRAHPGWQIGWVVEPRWQALLAASGAGARGSAMPVVDRLHHAAMRDWKRHPLTGKTIAEIKSLRRELRAANYDAVLDLQGAIRSAATAHLAGCRRIIGEAYPREWPAHLLFTERVATFGAHVIEQDIELASAIAADDLAYTEPVLPFDAEAEGWYYAQLEPASARALPQPLALVNSGDGPRPVEPVAVPRPLALLIPGAGWGAKRWPPESYASVARGLADRGFRVLVNAGPGEESLAAPIVATGAATALNTSLSQLIALTRRVALCVAGDTGPLHLACALGRPVIGIYGPTDPSRNGPYGTRARVLRSAGSRRDHSRRSDPDPGLLTITPEDVLRAADELFFGEHKG